MDQPRRDPGSVSGGMTALLVVLGFIGILLIGFGVTSVIRDPERTSVTAQPAAQAEPDTAPPQNPTQTPATELPPVKKPDVPTRSQQPSDPVDTAPATPPESKPGKPSPNVPATKTPTP